jgi:SAM-dependent methyltransferase
MGVVGDTSTHARTGWGAPDVVAQIEDARGWSDAGEALALGRVDDQAHGAVLDLGVGTGRTTGLLLETAASYVGLDLSPEMVARARRRHPGVDLRVGDASDLSAFADAAYDLVVFSFNGLDALSHPDRLRALGEMRRVVAPGGRVLFSSLNRDGVSFDERPLRVAGGVRSARFRRHPGTLVQSVRNHRRTRPGSVDAAGWSTRPLRAHEFRFLVHFATFAEAVDEARSAGLTPVAAYTDDGRPLEVDAARTDADWFHLVCEPD